MPAPAGTIFVLTTTEDRRDVPVAVVNNEQIADKWLAHSPKSNWLPFQMNDLSLTGMTGHTTFRPGQSEPPAVVEQRKRDIQQQQIETLKQTVVDLTEANKQMQRALRRFKVKSSLLKSAAEKAQERRKK